MPVTTRDQLEAETLKRISTDDFRRLLYLYDQAGSPEEAVEVLDMGVRYCETFPVHPGEELIEVLKIWKDYRGVIAASVGVDVRD